MVKLREPTVDHVSYHADDSLVDLATVDDTILVDRRYSTTRNIAGKPLYAQGARCIVRRHVADGLKVAHD